MTRQNGGDARVTHFEAGSLTVTDSGDDSAPGRRLGAADGFAGSASFAAQII